MSAAEIYALGEDFGKASAKVVPALFDTYQQEAKSFESDWRSNATATSGRHGKHYPKSITSEMKVGLSIVAEIGPESGRPQGSMGRGFEFGSVNQPPHLDGARAMAPAQIRLERAADATIGLLLP